MRLDKFLKENGICSRSEAKKILKQGLVVVNGAVIKDSDFKIDENNDVISYDGQVINYQEYVYLMVNKPAGVICATEDYKDRTILDLVNEYKHKSLFPFGRLDKDSEGLLIISNDGKLAHDLLSPKKHVNKKYYVDVEGFVTNEDIIKFQEGIMLDNELCKPALLEIIESNKTSKRNHRGI